MTCAAARLLLLLRLRGLRRGLLLLRRLAEHLLPAPALQEGALHRGRDALLVLVLLLRLGEGVVEVPPGRPAALGRRGLLLVPNRGLRRRRRARGRRFVLVVLERVGPTRRLLRERVRLPREEHVPVEVPVRGAAHAAVILRGEQGPRGRRGRQGLREARV